MTPTRPAVLAVLVLGAGLFTWVTLRSFYPNSIVLPWSAVPSLSLLALGEAFTAAMTRARLARKPGTKPIDPLVVARLAALAKASAHAAAVLAGIFGGFAIDLAPELDTPGLRHDFYVSGGTFLASGALIAAALWLEYVCRVPRAPDSDQSSLPPRP